jgi:hypothetical protein
MFICDLELADFIEYKPPNEINIVRVIRDDLWLNENLKKLENFWKEVEFYRNNDIKVHPKFPKPKNIIDLTDNLECDLEEDFEILNLNSYSIKEPTSQNKITETCVNKSVNKSGNKSGDKSIKYQEYIVLNKYSIKDI